MHHPSMRKWGVAVVGVVLAAFMASCGSGAPSVSGGSRGSATNPTSSTTAAATQVGDTYLCSQPNSLELVQWTNNHGSLSGSLQEVTTQGSPPQETTSQQTASITGTLQGSQVTLSVNGSPPLFGTLHSDSLLLNTPVSGGGLAGTVCQGSSPSGFDQSVQRLQSDVAQANATKSEEDQINKAASTAASDISTLAGTNFSGDIQQMQGDAQSIKADLATEQSDYNVFRSDLANNNQFGQACTDVGGSLNANAGGSVSGYEGGVLVPHVQQLQTDIVSTRNLIQAAHGDVQAYQQAQAELPAFTPNTPVGDLGSAASAAQGAIQQTVTQANGLIEQVNGYVAQAYRLANQANSEGNCGSPSQPPAPIGHIS